jgi:hypothetical protein
MVGSPLRQSASSTGRSSKVNMCVRRTRVPEKRNTHWQRRCRFDLPHTEQPHILTRRRPLTARARIRRVPKAVRIAPRRMRGLQAGTGSLRRLHLVLEISRGSDHATRHDTVTHPPNYGTGGVVNCHRLCVNRRHISDQIRSADSDRGGESSRSSHW